MTIICPQLGKVGRLGNQLYQVASTIGLGHRWEQPVCLDDDWDYREYFSIPAELFGRCGGTPASELATSLDERARVYLQDWNLFADIMPTIRKYLAPSMWALEMLETYDEFNALPRPIMSVHVRRGDNVIDPAVPEKWRYHICPPVEYYVRAMAHVTTLQGTPASIAVFSDDIIWCEQNISADYYHHGRPRAKEHEPEYLSEPAWDWVDWHMLASTELHVCSNSTFGIFAALVAGADSVVPWPFYGPELDYVDATLLIPPTWERMEYPC